MNKTVGLSGLVGLMAALNVSCGTHKPHTGKLDEKASNAALTGGPSPVRADTAEASTPAPESPTSGSTSESADLTPEPLSHPLTSHAHTTASQSKASEPGAQVMSPFTQETLPALPTQMAWQGESQAQDLRLATAQGKTSPWDAVQSSQDEQLFSSDLPSQQAGVDQKPSDGARLKQLNHDQAFDKVNQLFATEGKDGVLAYAEKNLLALEKDLAVLNTEDAAQYQQKLAQSRAAWQALSQASDDLDFVQKAADLLFDMSKVAHTMATLGGLASGD